MNIREKVSQLYARNKICQTTCCGISAGQCSWSTLSRLARCNLRWGSLVFIQGVRNPLCFYTIWIHLTFKFRNSRLLENETMSAISVQGASSFRWISPSNWSWEEFVARWRLSYSRRTYFHARRTAWSRAWRKFHLARTWGAWNASTFFTFLMLTWAQESVQGWLDSHRLDAPVPHKRSLHSRNATLNVWRASCSAFASFRPKVCHLRWTDNVAGLPLVLIQAEGLTWNKRIGSHCEQQQTSETEYGLPAIERQRNTEGTVCPRLVTNTIWLVFVVPNSLFLRYTNR